jgi:Protein of unknown function (DUF2752)
MHFRLKKTLSLYLNEMIKYFFICMAILFLLLVPDKLFFGGHTVCIFNHLTGCQCPLCGMTHATYYLVRLHPSIAFAYHPAVLWFPVLLIFEITHDLYPINRLFRLFRRYSWILFGITLIGIMIPRMICCFK